MNENKYTWKDIVKINKNLFAEEFEISGEMADSATYCIDDFMYAVAAKYEVPVNSIQTYMLDNLEFNPAGLLWGPEQCGCYINGVAEWLIDE